MNGDCISSNSDPSSFVVNRTAANDYSWVLGDYGNGQTCTIHLTGSLDLSIEPFDTEASYDTLTIDGQVYSGDIGPPSAIYSGDIVWRSDSSLVRAGWKICKSHPPWTITGPGCEASGDYISAVGVEGGYSVHTPGWLEHTVEKFDLEDYLPEEGEKNF